MNTSSTSESSYNIVLPFSIIYFMLFIFGSIGNGIVIVMISNVLSSIHKSRSTRRMSTTSHVFIYVLGLSIVDLLVLIHLPFLIFELWNKSFPFGDALCKLYWFGESVNKLLSSFLMCVLSWDRYLAVCKPVNSISIRSNSVAIFVLFSTCTLAIVLLLPVLIQSEVTFIDRLSPNRTRNIEYGSVEYRKAAESGSLVSKCSFDPDPIFVVYTFSVGFAIPALLISFFYAQVIVRLRSNSNNMLGDHKRSDANGRNSIAIRVHQVTKRIVMVIFFYFFCWTPQWTITLLIQYEIIGYDIIPPFILLLISLSAHVLVCFNSAANPLLYALINRELRAQHIQAMARKRQSITAATQVALEFVIQATNNDLSNRHPSILSLDPIRPASSPSVIARIRFHLAGFKLNLFSSGTLKKRSVSRTPSNKSQLSVENTKETVQIGSNCQLKEESEIISLTTGDAFL
ncbi:hypothetical protein PFISCL1PPCAC_15445 [Pristionchus fissidentatus]|uniref:G-protein coupled receptors family 1 profile domain-containing protein n=1 Tax=Pristionchus fissidentatus TaxID=1538716 RepID=A0AAV5W0Z5_9BILA|nr:hypothetical protein PFISCL1PPCAC_15445 [Pristionchus fissidentatus]